jgi:hypothetical protein
MVAAFRSDSGASRQVLHAALARRFELLLSVPLVLEYEAVLCRPEHLAASGASREDVRDLLDGVIAVGKRVRFAFRWRCQIPTTIWFWKPRSMGKRTRSSPSTNTISIRLPLDLAAW